MRTLREYLTQDRVLFIPPWQREYSWQTSKEGQVDTLLDDLLAFAKDPSATEYLLGSVILCADPNSRDSNQVQLIDGQQRTLTLSLLFMCARKHIRTHRLAEQNNDAHSRLTQDIRSCLTLSDDDIFEPRVSMNQDKANNVLSALFDWANATTSGVGEEIFKNADAQTLTQRNLADVARFIFNQLQDEAWEDAHFIEWFRKILDGVKIIELQLDSQSEAIAVYDRINNRGMQLNSADLVKNILFQSVPDDTFEEISENWKNTVVKLNECEKRARMQEPKYLLRALAGQESGKKFGYDELVGYWSERLKGDSEISDPAGSDVKVTLPKLDAVGFSETLSTKAAILAKLAQNVGPFGALDDIFPAAEMGSVQHFPVLMAGSHLIDEDVYLHLARQVNARTMLYILGKERNQIFEAMIPSWTWQLSQLPPEATVQDVNGVFKKAALPTTALWENLDTQIKSWTYSNASDRKKIRAVLAYLSVDLDSLLKKEVKFSLTMQTRKQKGAKHGWDIEHVMPQKIDKSDPFQRIGNLVLLSPNDNRSASDSHPSEKEVYYNQCELSLTKSLSDLEKLKDSAKREISKIYRDLGVDLNGLALADWGIQAVAKRTDFYSKYFKQALERHMA